MVLELAVPRSADSRMAFVPSRRSLLTLLHCVLCCLSAVSPCPFTFESTEKLNQTPGSGAECCPPPACPVLTWGWGRATSQLCFPGACQRAGSCSPDTRVLFLGHRRCGKALVTAVGRATVLAAGGCWVSVLTGCVGELGEGWVTSKNGLFPSYCPQELSNPPNTDLLWSAASISSGYTSAAAAPSLPANL